MYPPPLHPRQNFWANHSDPKFAVKYFFTSRKEAFYSQVDLANRDTAEELVAIYTIEHPVLRLQACVSKRAVIPLAACS